MTEQLPDQDLWLKLSLTLGAALCGGLGMVLVWMMCSAALCPPLTRVINPISFPSPHWFIPSLFLPWAWSAENKTPNSRSSDFYSVNSHPSGKHLSFSTTLGWLGWIAAIGSKTRNYLATSCQNTVDTTVWIHLRHCNPAFPSSCHVISIPSLPMGLGLVWPGWARKCCGSFAGLIFLLNQLIREELIRWACELFLWMGEKELFPHTSSRYWGSGVKLKICRRFCN